MRIHQTALAMPMREAAASPAKMLLQALPLAVLLFLFFPRLPGQFWALPARSQAHSGLDDEMSPGRRVRAQPFGRSGVSRALRRRDCRRRASATGAGRCCTISTAARGVVAPQLLLPQEVADRRRRRIAIESRSSRISATGCSRSTCRPAGRDAAHRSARPTSSSSRADEPIAVLTSFDLQSRAALQVTGDRCRPSCRCRSTLRLPADRNPRSRRAGAGDARERRQRRSVHPGACSTSFATKSSSTRSSRRGSTRIRSTTSCSTRGAASASTSRRRSR